MVARLLTYSIIGMAVGRTQKREPAGEPSFIRCAVLDGRVNSGIGKLAEIHAQPDRKEGRQ